MKLFIKYIDLSFLIFKFSYYYFIEKIDLLFCGGFNIINSRDFRLTAKISFTYNS